MSERFGSLFECSSRSKVRRLVAGGFSGKAKQETVGAALAVKPARVANGFPVVSALFPRAVGVPTMVASQWKVDSASTAKLMIAFHKRLKVETATNSHSKASSLQQAALTLMKEPRYRHPYFWAGFVVIGKTS